MMIKQSIEQVPAMIAVSDVCGLIDRVSQIEV
jgi:hypothetical protein